MQITVRKVYNPRKITAKLELSRKKRKKCFRGKENQVHHKVTFTNLNARISVPDEDKSVVHSVIRYNHDIHDSAQIQILKLEVHLRRVPAI